MVGPSIDAFKPRPAARITVKFLCSYGGKILPRYTDGKLRYLGGETRVLSVHRSISFSELMSKMRELCGTAVCLRCQFPTEDLDALISITSDEDLSNLMEEYDRSPPPPSPSCLKIRAFLSLPKKISPPHSLASSGSSSSSLSSLSTTITNGSRSSTSNFTPRFSKCLHQFMEKPKPAVSFPVSVEKYAGNCNNSKMMMMMTTMMMGPQGSHYAAHGNPGHGYLIHNGNHWQ